MMKSERVRRLPHLMLFWSDGEDEAVLVAMNDNFGEEADEVGVFGDGPYSWRLERPLVAGHKYWGNEKKRA